MSQWFNPLKVDLSLDKISAARLAVKAALDGIVAEINTCDKITLFDFSAPELCKLDPAQFRDWLRAAGLTAVAEGRYVVAYGKAYREREEREWSKLRRYAPNWNWDDDTMRFHKWWVHGRF